MTYQVSLTAFHGPLDLLLYLVKRQEVDIHHISLASITDQFLEFLRSLNVLNVEIAGDFLVMAATLMEIKVRSLLPQTEESEAQEIADPRRQLVKQLLEYRKFKDAAAALEHAAHTFQDRVPRIPPHEATEAGQPLVKPVELWDLLSAFHRLMRETQSLQPKIITIDDTPQEVYERMVLEFVRKAHRVAFVDVFQPPRSRSKLIGLFLAILELIKRGAVLVEQDQPFQAIWLQLPPPSQILEPTAASDTP